MALGYGRTNSNNFALPRYIVDSNGLQTGATHTTVVAAVASAAVNPGVVALRPGTYTENITGHDGLELVAFESEARFGDVEIVGKISLSSGTMTITGIRLTTNSAYFLETTSTGTVELLDCYLNALNNDGIHQNSSGAITCRNCNGDIGTTGIRLFVVSAGTLAFRYCNTSNSGGSTTSNTIATGASVTFQNSEMPVICTTAGTGAVNSYYSRHDNSATNSTFLTTVGTGTSTITDGTIQSGSGVAVSVGAGTTVAINETVISSTNASALDGAGTQVLTSISYSNTSSTNSVTTTTNRNFHVGGLKIQSATAYTLFAGPSAAGGPIQQVSDTGTTGQVLTSNDSGALPTWEDASGGNLVLISAATASSSSSITFTGLSSTYNSYLCVMSHIIPATDAVVLYIRTSTNNGVSYDSGVSDYAHYQNYFDYALTPSEADDGDNADDGLRLCSNTTGKGLGTGSNEEYNGYVYLYNLSSTSQHYVSYRFDMRSSDGGLIGGMGGGVRLDTTAINAIQFILSSGNIASGTFNLYGLTAS